MNILVNGIGCPDSGTRVVLMELLKCAPPGHTYFAMIVRSKESIDQRLPENVKVKYYNHKIWGKYFRILLELKINFVLLIGKFDRLINLSHYGLVFTKKQFLFIHNALLFESKFERGFGNGRPNVLIDIILSHCLNKVDRIYVQTNQMENIVSEYAHRKRIKNLSTIRVLKPLPVSSEAFVIADRFKVQKQVGQFILFYPTKEVTYKKNQLAVDSARHLFPGINLCLYITLDGVDEQSVRYLGRMQREEVLRMMQGCDALLFPSEFESLGLPLLEALNYEKPAVLPDLPYAREIYGSAGVYFKDHTVSSVSGAIVTLKENYNEISRLVASRKQHEWTERLTWSQHWEYFLS